jgi:hypothetical protein
MRAADPIGFLCKVCNGDRMQAAEEREGTKRTHWYLFIEFLQLIKSMS